MKVYILLILITCIFSKSCYMYIKDKRLGEYRKGWLFFGSSCAKCAKGYEAVKNDTLQMCGCYLTKDLDKCRADSDCKLMGLYGCWNKDNVPITYD